jgi:general secretion pathway protein B
MSFLLDALRKSENQEHRGQVPTIHSTDGLEYRRRRSFNPGLVLLIMLPALLILCWYTWQYYTEGNKSTAEPAAGKVSTPHGGANPAEAPPTEWEEVGELPQIPKPPLTVSTLRPERTAVENYSETGVFEAEQGLEPVTAEGLAQTIEQGTSNLPMPPADLQTEAPVAGEESVPATSNSPIGEPKPAQDYRQPQFSLISYWRLPEPIRQEISPPPRISVLVYADHPDDRFLLMNGSRFVEGDEPMAGMVLEEIRRDGAVFSYRLYRFLVTQ